MKEIFDATQLSTIASPALPFVLDAAVKSAVILALGGIVAFCLGRASASTRHWVWFLAMASLLLLPVLSLMLPGWHILPRWFENAPIASAPQSTEQFVHGTKLYPTEDLAFAQGAGFPSPVKSETESPSSLAHQPLPLRDEVLSASEVHRMDFWTWSLSLWLAGTVLALAPAVLGMISLWQLGRRSKRVIEWTWLELLRRLLMRLSFKRSVALLKSSRRRMPMTWGWLRPKVLLPDEAEDWPEERRRVVLLHELAHVKRRDYLTNLIAQIVCAVYWFNPLVWLAARRMVIERERACDDIVLSQGATPANYAEQVLQIASGLPSDQFAAYGAIAMARPSRLEGRLLAILDSKRNRRAMTRWAVTVSIILLASFVFPLAMMRTKAQDSANGKESSLLSTLAELGPAKRVSDAANGEDERERAQKRLPQYSKQEDKVSFEDNENITLQALKHYTEAYAAARSEAEIAQKIIDQVTQMLQAGAPLETIPYI